MIHKISHEIVDLYDFEYHHKKYIITIVNNSRINVIYRLNDTSFVSIFHCNLKDNKQVAKTLELFSYTGLENLEARKIEIDGVEYSIQDVNGKKRVFISKQYQFMINHEDRAYNVQELSGRYTTTDPAVYPEVNAAIILSILLWINMRSGLKEIYKNILNCIDNSGEIVTFQPNGCLFRYCLVSASPDLFTINVIGFPRDGAQLITDYNSNGIYEIQNVKTTTLIYQRLISKDILKDLYTRVSLLFY